MSEPVLIGRQRTLLHDLAGLVDERSRAEPALAESYHAEKARATQALQQGREFLRLRFSADVDELDRELRQARAAIESRHAAEMDVAQKEHGERRLLLTNQLDVEQEAAESAVQEARWAADALLDGARGDATKRLRDNNGRLASRVEELQGHHQQARALLQEWNQPVSELEAVAATSAKRADQPLRKMTECIQEVRDLVEELQELVVPRFLKGNRLLGLTLLLWLALIFPLGWLGLRVVELERNLAFLFGLGIAASTVVSVLVGLASAAILRRLARKQVAAVYQPLCEVLVEAEATRQRLLKRYQVEHDEAVNEAQQRFERDMAKVRAKQQALKEVGQRRVTGAAQLDETLRSRRTASDQRRTTEFAASDQRHQQGTTQTTQQYDRGLEQLDAEHRSRLEAIDTGHHQQWRTLVEKWQRGLAEVQRDAALIGQESATLFPDWDDPRWKNFQAPAALPPAFRFGSYQVRAQSVVAAEPWTALRPAPEPIDLTLPALASFPEPRSLLFHAQDEGRDLALEALRTAMFRLLTSLAPGKVRFVIIDPVGLGQNFAAFMNLADYDEALVGGRIWTEATHIEQRLADLTAHMENVIQKYLRNRYPTISDYNIHAGEVAEPYRVLVVANFPANFTTEAARRLQSIAQSGPRCGVSTLISIDSRLQVPREFELADLERCGENLVWMDGRFRWRDEDFAPHPLTLDQLPGDDFCNRILHQVGEGARGAHRVEVPFEFIAPAVEKWWTGSTRTGVSVALGRAGATRRQFLELGKGTSQHALIVGKTGSGKSTLLHALITNLALLYSPDEVELYLVDFKKGVEFKTYAAHDLPHARVIAIESEREFGLSVLQRLDTELKSRGERFRTAGAQDLNGYRQATAGDPEVRSPRILLIVDEFQEFFVEDDRIAQEASQLLDRLVRQGRAFGMHILLGSQTLGGAFSLARSTIDQMAVRIALQCSEADAHLVLSEDNSAARLLSRPGEAIYNDANGLVEGNDPFQVVWLGESQREQYLNRVHALDEQRTPRHRPAPVIFEGNASADVTKNHLLNRLLAVPPTPPAADEEPLARVEDAWLGEAMAIDVLTSAAFRRQNASNLLIIGQQAEAALGMLTTGVISLAAHAVPGQNGTTSARFYVVDGHQADPPRTGVLARLPDVLPEPIRVVGWRDLPAVLTELSTELERRQKLPLPDAPALYLVLYGLQRMRVLRRAEDDFGGFMGGGRGGEEQTAAPDKQLTTLLREGSALGIHVLLWCDTLNNLQRAFDRGTVREMAMRVVFQLSVADSSNLIDSPAASKLGMHRALFSSEEDGRLEKFRPYGVPTEEWLSWVREQFQQRGSPSALVGTPSLALRASPEEAGG